MDMNQAMIRKLESERDKLNRIIERVQERARNEPEGGLRTVRHGKGYQYYHRTDPQKRSGTYIPIAEKDLAVRLAQKQYDKKVLKAANRQMAVIDRFLREYDPKVLNLVYENQSNARRELITPEEVTDELYAEQWQRREYTHKLFLEGTPEHYTDKGERVRSKSEVLIANALYRAGIPYHYEYPLRVGRYQFYPDFLILRTSDRKEYLWEHLGRMDDAEYQANAYQRMREYEKSGIYPGEELIITEETSINPLNLSVVKQKIRHYFG